MQRKTTDITDIEEEGTGSPTRDFGIPKPPQKPLLSQIDFSEVSLEDFEFYEKLGSGSYGQVYRTKFKLNDEIYALKKLDKDFITKVCMANTLFMTPLQNQKMKNLQRERDILMSVDNPNITKLYLALRVRSKTHVYNLGREKSVLYL